MVLGNVTEAATAKPGHVFAICPRCYQNCYLICLNCAKTDGLTLIERGAQCSCGSLIESVKCSCGASIHRVGFSTTTENDNLREAAKKHDTAKMRSEIEKASTPGFNWIGATLGLAIPAYLLFGMAGVAGLVIVMMVLWTIIGLLRGAGVIGKLAMSLVPQTESSDGVQGEGHESNPSVSPDAGDEQQENGPTGLLAVTRPFRWSSGGVRFMVVVDGNEVGKLPNGKTMTVSLAVGKRSVIAAPGSIWGGSPTQPLSVAIAEGQTTMLRMEFGLWGPRLKLVNDHASTVDPAAAQAQA